MKTQITFLYRREKGWNEEFYTTATQRRNTNGKSGRRVLTVRSADEFSVSPIKNRLLGKQQESDAVVMSCQISERVN